ncbi:MAG: NnrU family protein [Boseongicola sp.]
MITLVFGLVLWTLAHIFKRVAPGPRAALQDRLGDASKGVFAVAILFALVLIVIGYRAAPFVVVYEPPTFLHHLNNILMLVAVALFGLGNSKSRFRGALRHPMLTGAAVWAVAHLLANGDLASVVLFGWMLIWALAEMPLINTSEPNYTPSEPGTAAGDIKLGIITLVIFAAIAGVHTWLGYFPFGG